MNIWWFLLAWVLFFAGIALRRHDESDAYTTGFIVGIFVILCILKASP